MTTWSARIQDLQKAGMTLSEIAEAIGLTTGAVGDIKSGRSKSPRGDSAMKLNALHSLKCDQDQRGFAA